MSRLVYANLGFERFGQGTNQTLVCPGKSSCTKKPKRKTPASQLGYTCARQRLSLAVARADERTGKNRTRLLSSILGPIYLCSTELTTHLTAERAALSGPPPTNHAEFFFHSSTSKEFAVRAARCKAKTLQLLGLFEGFELDDEDPEVYEVQDALSGALDMQLDNVDLCLDAHRNDLEGELNLGVQSSSSAITPKGSEKVPFHVASLARPQDMFDTKPDNSNAPFVLPPPIGAHGAPATGRQGALAKLESQALGGAARHPLADVLLSQEYPEAQLLPAPPRLPPALETCPLTMVETPEALEQLVETLRHVDEVSVDLENHHYRSFQGFTCLMQLSTRTEDFLIDLLALRSHVRDALGPLFLDAAVLKVFHGGDSDIKWLQRDFGIYVVNMFDTGQACRELELAGCGLAFLLDYLCQVKADKRFQLADWRIRPLTSDMKHYARMDTHYLLYMYDRLKELLAQKSPAAIRLVFQRSCDVCMGVYEKELLTPTTYLNFYKNCERRYSPEQLGVLAKLYAWRDDVARSLDESPGYVLPKAALLRLCDAMPNDTGEMLSVCRGASPLMTTYAQPPLMEWKNAVMELQEVVGLVQSARKQAAESTKTAAPAPSAVLSGTHTVFQRSEDTTATTAPTASTTEARPTRSRARISLTSAGGGMGSMLGGGSTFAGAASSTSPASTNGLDAMPSKPPEPRCARLQLATASSGMMGGGAQASPSGATTGVAEEHPEPPSAANAPSTTQRGIAGESAATLLQRTDGESAGLIGAFMRATPAGAEAPDAEAAAAADAAQRVLASLSMPQVAPIPIPDVVAAAKAPEEEPAEEALPKPAGGVIPAPTSAAVFEDVISLDGGLPESALEKGAKQGDQKSRGAPLSLSDTYSLHKKKHKRKPEGPPAEGSQAAQARARVDALLGGAGSLSSLDGTMSTKLLSKSERKHANRQKEKEQVQESARRDEFTVEGNFDYAAARATTPFGSGFGLLQASGSSAPKRENKKNKKNKKPMSASWFSKDMMPLEDSGWKAAKKSQVFPRSGNRQTSFTKQ